MNTILRAYLRPLAAVELIFIVSNRRSRLVDWYLTRNYMHDMLHMFMYLFDTVRLKNSHAGRVDDANLHLYHNTNGYECGCTYLFLQSNGSNGNVLCQLQAAKIINTHKCTHNVIVN